jgi:hypothetical protein
MNRTGLNGENYQAVEKGIWQPAPRRKALGFKTRRPRQSGAYFGKFSLSLYQMLFRNKFS